jgi:hypothetical protein
MPNFQATVITTTGELIFQGEPLPGDARLHPRGVRAGQARGSRIEIRSADWCYGLEAGDEAVLPAEHTHVGFATSLVVTDFSESAVGRPRGPAARGAGVRPGRRRTCRRAATRSPTACCPGSRTGRSRRCRRCPPSGRSSSVYRHAGAFALGRADGAWRTVDGDGVGVGQFVPTPTTERARLRRARPVARGGRGLPRLCESRRGRVPRGQRPRRRRHERAVRPQRPDVAARPARRGPWDGR